MYEIRIADPTDCLIIQDIAEKTWPGAYGRILSAGQLRYMLDLFYSEASLTRQMNTDKHRFIIISENNIPLGFASYSRKKNDEPGLYRLHKLYVLPSCQGKGLGKQLIDFILDDIGHENGHALELNVNRHNKARHFYEKLGFKVLYEEDIPIGSGYFMNDYVMSLDI